MSWNNSNLFTVLIVTGGPGSGLFVYSPVPGPGNLLASLGQGTADPYGNTVTPGFTLYDSSGSPRILMGFGANPYFQLQNSAGAVIGLLSTLHDSLTWYQDLGTAVQGPIEAAIGGKAATDPFGNAIPLGITSQDSSGTLQSVLQGAYLTMQRLSGAFVPPTITLLDAVTGSKTLIRCTEIDTPQVNAYVPGSPSTIETWNPVTFANGYAQAAGRTPTAYRFLAAPPSCVEWRGSIVMPAGYAATQGMITAVPAGYRPQYVKSLDMKDVTANSSVRGTFSAGGVLQAPAGVAAGDTVDIPDCTIVNVEA